MFSDTAKANGSRHASGEGIGGALEKKSPRAACYCSVAVIWDRSASAASHSVAVGLFASR